jgi:Superinfection exclusion gene product 17
MSTKPGSIYEGFLATFPKPIKGHLRIWWVPQVPCAPFHWPVSTLDQAAQVLNMLAAYDDFQFAQNVKGDYCNAGGLEVCNDAGEWESWYSEEGEEFDEYRMRLL